MKRPWGLLSLGTGAFVVLALCTLPAQLLASYLGSSGVQAGGLTGTIWNGRAQALQVGAVHLGGVQWELHVLPLLTARLSADVSIKRLDGFAQARVSVSPSGRIRFADLSASLPLGALPATATPGGWTGTLNLRLSELALNNGWPLSAAGTVELVDFTGPAQRPNNLGSYKITFPEDPPSAEALVGVITDVGEGPLQVAGKVQLKAERSYLVEGRIATRAQAPREITNVVQFLGEPDGEGLRPFSFAGTM
jgi:general secretion pathway protein N